MDLNHKINKVNMLIDEIEEQKRAYETYEDIPKENLVYIARANDIANNMIIDLIKRGAWS